MSDQANKNPRIKQGWLRVLLFGGCFAIITLLIAIPAVMIIAGLKKEDLEKDLIGSLSGLLTGNFLWLMLLLEFVIALTGVWLFRVFIDRKSMASLGFGWEGFKTEGITGLLMGPALLGLTSIVMLLSGHLQWTDISLNAQSLMISLGMMVLIAFSEELVFRGYILGNLLDSFSNKYMALAISAILFASFHLTNPGMNTIAFANLFLAGFLLGLNYIYTRNLWFSLLLHLSWNFVQGPILGSNVSGLNLPSLLEMETNGDTLLTGGQFGLEGSILNTAVSLTAILILAWAFERRYVSAPAQ